MFALGPRPGLLGGKAVRAKRRRHHVQGLVVLTAVQRDLETVGEQKSFAGVGKLLLANEIPPPDLEAVEAQFLAELIHGPLNGEAGMRPAAAAVRRHSDRRRVDGLELDPDVGDSVRTGN